MRNIIGNSVDKAITALVVMLWVLSNRLTNSTKAFLRPGHGKPGVRAAFLMLSLIAALIMTSPAAIAESGDFSIDFVAANPYSYDHLIGGGAYDDRTIGVDVVESLEGGDFDCGDIVTYFALVTVANTQSAIDDQPQTIEMDFSFLADTTGQSGVAIGDIVLVQVNYGTIEDLVTGENGIDDGIIDDGGSTATLIDESLTGPLFTSKSELHGTVELDDLEPGEQVVVRIDVKLFCDPGSAPTGNLAGALPDARLTYINGSVPVDPPEAISVGKQTVPFKQIGDICFPELVIEKTVTDSGDCSLGVDDLTVTSGDTVKYCYVVTNPNTCGAPLYNIKVVDDNGTSGNTADDFIVTLDVGLSDEDGDGSFDDLAAGGTASGSESFILYYTSGLPVTNTGTATGNDSIIEPTTLTASDTAAVTVEGVPSIAVVKTSDATGTNQVGDVIT
ncbi:MAG: internalin, partial [ANME-2 cluster archaeon]|nr:internalin [ANME-2 cluster archaeon]